MKKNFNITAALAAASAGATFQALIAGASRQSETVAENYLPIKMAAGSTFGAALVYFGKTETVRAAGYGMLGTAGSAATAFTSSYIDANFKGDSDVPETMQGRRKRKRLKRFLTAKPIEARQTKMMIRNSDMAAPVMTSRVSRSSRGKMMEVQPEGDYFTRMAFAESVF